MTEYQVHLYLVRKMEHTMKELPNSIAGVQDRKMLREFWRVWVQQQTRKLSLIKFLKIT